MKISIYRALAAVAGFAALDVVHGNISVIQAPPVQDLVTTLLPPGSGITVTNTVFTGDLRCAAKYSQGQQAVPEPWFPDTGIILSSGGPASLDMQDTSGTDSVCYNTAGDGDLNGITGGFMTEDACILTIEFTVDADVSHITLKYVFGSDEYNEFVNSSFNDAFALFLNGNNIAFVPGTNTAVSINNINGGANAGVFNDNTAGQYPLFEADGFTLALDALGAVQAGTNVLKLAIADTSDCSIDSWVLIQGDSLKVAQPPSSFGDPHFRTWLGEDFDYMGACDLVLLDAPNFGNGLGLHIDIRTTARYAYSYIESAVLLIGNETFEVDSYGQYSVGAIDYADLKDKDSTLSGFPIVHSKDESKIQVFDVILSPTANITFGAFKDLVFVKLSRDTTLLGASTGIMGSSLTGSMLSRSGNIMDMSNENAINIFGQEWQVRADEPRLFRTSRPPQASHGEKCILPETNSKQSLRRRLKDNKIAKSEAEVACAHLKGGTKAACVGDVVAIGDLDMAQSY